MKRYLLFVGQFYYPDAGWDGFASSFDRLSDAVKTGESMLGHWLTDKEIYDETHEISFEWWQVVDSSTSTIIAQSHKY